MGDKGDSIDQSPAALKRRREVGGLRYQLVDVARQLALAEGQTNAVREAIALLADNDGAVRRMVEAIDGMAEGFILFDSEDRIVFVNARYREFYPEISDLLVPGARHAEIAATALSRRAAGMKVRLDGWVRGVTGDDSGAADREEVLLDGRWVRVSERSLEGGGRVGTQTDITELKLREESLRELERLKSEFVNNVSHELRTPLTAIHASLGLMSGGATGTLPDEAAELVQVALRNSDRLLRLVNDILDLGKIEADAMRFEIGTHDLVAVVARAVADAGGYGAAHGVTLEFTPAVASAPAQLDPERFVQALTNLLGNAVKFSPRGSVVAVDLAPREAMWRVVVADRGAGIPLDQQARVFDRFFQAGGTSGAVRGGTGLGLTIARSIMQNLGGAIGFESEPERGTRFWLDVRRAA